LIGDGCAYNTLYFKLNEHCNIITVFSAKFRNIITVFSAKFRKYLASSRFYPKQKFVPCFVQSLLVSFHAIIHYGEVLFLQGC